MIVEGVRPVRSDGQRIPVLGNAKPGLLTRRISPVPFLAVVQPEVHGFWRFRERRKLRAWRNERCEW